MSAWAVRIERGLVTHWRNRPLETWEEADACREAIEDFTGERGRIERLLLSAPAERDASASTLGPEAQRQTEWLFGV